MNDMHCFLENACLLARDKAKLAMSQCETPKYFFDQRDTWIHSYAFSQAEFTRCLECATLFKMALVNCEQYATISRMFNEAQQFTGFFAEYSEEVIKNGGIQLE